MRALGHARVDFQGTMNLSVNTFLQVNTQCSFSTRLRMSARDLMLCEFELLRRPTKNDDNKVDFRFHSFQRFVASIVKCQTPIVRLLLTFLSCKSPYEIQMRDKKVESWFDNTFLTLFPSRVKGRRVEQDFKPMQEQQGAAWICLSTQSCCVSRAELKCALKLKYQMSRVIPSNFFHINQLHFDALHNIALYPDCAHISFS